MGGCWRCTLPLVSLVNEGQASISGRTHVGSVKAVIRGLATKPSGGHCSAGAGGVELGGGRIGPVRAAAEGTKCRCTAAGAVAGLQPPADPLQEPSVCPWRGWGQSLLSWVRPLAAPRSPRCPLCHPPAPEGCSEEVTGGDTGLPHRGPGGRRAVPRRRWRSVGGGLPLEVPGQHCLSRGQSQPPRVTVGRSPRGCRPRSSWMAGKRPPPRAVARRTQERQGSVSKVPEVPSRAGGDESHQLGAATGSFGAPSFSFCH